MPTAHDHSRWFFYETIRRVEAFIVAPTLQISHFRNDVDSLATRARFIIIRLDINDPLAVHIIVQAADPLSTPHLESRVAECCKRVRQRRASRVLTYISASHGYVYDTFISLFSHKRATYEPPCVMLLTHSCKWFSTLSISYNSDDVGEKSINDSLILNV